MERVGWDFPSNPHERSAFRERLDTIGWPGRHLAARLDRNEHLVCWWGAGESAVPPGIVAWLICLARYHASHPAPNDWRAHVA